MYSETHTNSGEETPTKKWVGWGLTFKTHTLMIMHKMITPLVCSLKTLSLVYLQSWDHIIESEGGSASSPSKGEVLAPPLPPFFRAMKLAKTCKFILHVKREHSLNLNFYTDSVNTRAEVNND